MNPADDQDETNERDLLSSAGAARRRAILADALRQADRQRRARLARSALAVGACVAGVIVLAFVLAPRDAAPLPASPQVVIDGSPARPTREATTKTTPLPRPSTQSIAARRSSPPPSPGIVVEVIPAEPVERRWEVLDDDQFLAALADAGQPSGIARVNGKALVIPLR